MATIVAVRRQRVKQGREPHAILGISWYHRMFDAIAEVSHKLKLI
jgi:hypothetical protein